MAIAVSEQGRESALAKARDQHRSGELDEARALYETLLRDAPNDHEVLDLLSTVVRQQRDFRAALDLSRKASSISPTTSLYLFNLGEGCRANGLFGEAVQAYQHCLSLFADAWAAHLGLGQAYASLGRQDEARDAFTTAAGLNPRSARPYEQLAVCLMRQGLLKEAEAACREVVRLEPAFASHYGRLAAVLAARGKLRAAEAECRRAIELTPESAPLHVELARALNGMGLPVDSTGCALNALRADGNSLGAFVQAGIGLKRQRQLTNAAGMFLRALEHQPQNTEALVGLAGVETQQMSHEAAICRFRRAQQASPQNLGVHSKLLEVMNYVPDTDEMDIFHEHVRWGNNACDAVRGGTVCELREPNPDRVVRVGYASADLRAHPIPFFLEPILTRHDRERFQPVVFSDVIRPDAVTRRLQGTVSEWHDTSALSDDAFAQLVQRNRVDILVDLAGHSSRGRLLAIARKPAPVQVTYLGYPNTTGLPRETMGYRLTDGTCDPPGEADGLHTERLSRLPDAFITYRPSLNAPSVTEPPALKGNGVTFGCFNGMVKINSKILQCWAAILQQTTNSRLMLKNKALADVGTCDLIATEFAKHGVSSDRLILLPHDPTEAAHLSRYGRIDIALDTFPYSGTTTTCEALWMGVPVITWAGRAHRNRVGASIMGALGLTELIAQSSDTYVQKSVELAGSVAKLAALRRELRDRMESSPLRDEAGFVNNLENTYRLIWCEACQGTATTTLRGGEGELRARPVG